MKKLLAALVALVAINASAYDVTNTVTIVSNIYNRISEEHWITNNIKNTHTNYHYTNNFYTVSNVTLLVSQTNVHTTATYDMGRSMLSIMSNDVNSAKASIRSTADEAAGSASNASYSASSAISSAASAQNTLNNVNTRGAEIINAMNSKQEWFDENYGKMITNTNISVTTNIYNNEDTFARASISNLDQKVDWKDHIIKITSRNGKVTYALYVDGRLDETAEVDSSSAVDYRRDGTDFYRYSFTHGGDYWQDFPKITSIMMVKNTGRLRFTINGTSATYTEIEMNPSLPIDKNVLPQFDTEYFTVSGYRCKIVFVSADRFVDYYLSADLGIYNPDGTLKDRLVTESSNTGAMSNELERVLQVAMSSFSQTRAYSPDHSKYISGDLGLYNSLVDTASAPVPMSFVGSDGTILTRIRRQTVSGVVYYIYVSSENIDGELGTANPLHPDKAMVIHANGSNWRIIKLFDQNNGWQAYVNSFDSDFITKNGSDGHEVLWRASPRILIYGRGTKIGTIQVQ